MNDFVAGGMENTSATTLTDSTLFTDATENIRNSEGLISHEMAHQWFGDLVTCKDWSHIWLNEGFATYYAIALRRPQERHDAMLYELYQNARQITGMRERHRTPSSGGLMTRPSECSVIWPILKRAGCCTCCALDLGEDLYRRCIKTYLERHDTATWSPRTCAQVIEELSGRSYDQFFDQWLYHAHHPELEAGYSWDENAKLAKVSSGRRRRLMKMSCCSIFPSPSGLRVRSARWIARSR